MKDVPIQNNEMTPKKRALLEMLLQKEGITSSVAPRIARRKESDFSPLSFAQQRLWFLNELEPDTSAYNNHFALRLSGPLNQPALEQSINEIIRRHETLRTSFHYMDGQPTQIIAPFLSLASSVVDLRRLHDYGKEIETRKLAVEVAGRIFDQTHTPLLRIKLIRLDDDVHVLLLIIHHIISDGWSLRVFMHELSSLYEVFVTGCPSSLPELPIQYADFAIWQQQRLKGDTLESLLDYWMKQLDGAPTTLELLTDKPRSAVQTHRGAIESVALAEPITKSLKELCHSAGVTPFMLLLSAFQVLLYRYTGQEDFLIGTPIANRKPIETEGLIGFFANTLVLRSDLSGNPRFSELLACVKEMSLGAFDHQDVPFDILVDRLQPARSLGHTPLFQVAFVLQDNWAPAATLSGMELGAFKFGHSTAKFDLTLLLEETSQGVSGWLEYSTDLFEAPTIQRMSEHFHNLIQSIVDNAHQRVSDLKLLAQHEENQLLIEWNKPQEYPSDKCIHEVFEVQVVRTPQRIAVASAEEMLSYGELDERANRLARHLQSLGVGPEVRVGVCVNRSLNMIVALLGILKAGGAYVPLDPQYPRPRLNFMLDDAQVGVLLSEGRLDDEIECEGIEVVHLDSLLAGLAAAETGSEVDRVKKASSSNMAYVIYTSGSTGKPKGVAIEHRSAVAMIDWGRKTFSGELAAVLASTSICFDLSVFEIFVPLSVGGKVIVTEDALSLVELPNAEDVTLINTVPSAMRELVRQRAVPRSVRAVNLAGEALKRTLVEEIYEQETIHDVYNLYGPSEDTTYSTFAKMEKGGRGEPVIGRPISNTQVYLLDGRMNLVPVGVGGELCLSGAGLGRGYLMRPELTAERFIPNPFSEEEGGRLYKTGDLARYLRDGEIDYLGRIDHQVKIRGFRIELGEIESVLEQHPAIDKSVVIAREEKSGDKRVVAYIVERREQRAAVSELRSYLRERLPEYMIPSMLVKLESIPLTSTGKVDRRALPEPAQMREEQWEEMVTPGSPLEEVIAAIWGEVLGIERIDINENFFELGGHSLLAAQIVSRMRQALELEIPLRWIFERPTIREIAGVVEAEMRGDGGKEAPALRPVPRGGELPLSFSQQRLWLLDQLEPGNPAYNMTSAVKMRGRLEVGELERSLNRVIERHESLRTNFRNEGGRPHQVIKAEKRLKVGVVDLRWIGEERREEELNRLTREHARRAFDLSEGELLRVRVLRVADEEHRLLLAMHHIISDGWSMRVFIREATSLYAEEVTGRKAELADLRIQYADYSGWQKEWFQGEVLEKEMRYWREQLAGSAEVLELPADRSRVTNRRYSGGHQSLLLPMELSRRLKELSRQENSTLFMTLLSAFKILIYRYSGQNDIIIGSPISGRDRIETEGLIGCFINTLVLRTILSHELSFLDVLSRVRETTLGAYSHQGLPFEKLLEELEPHRDLSKTPLFQVMFNMFNFDDQQINLPGLTAEILQPLDEISKFDLTLYVEEQNDAILLKAVFNNELFDDARIAETLNHFRVLLEAVVTDPRRRISNLPLLTEDEKRDRALSGNIIHPVNPFIEFPAEETEQSIHHRFEAQVKKYPDKIAVKSRNYEWTYEELDKIATRMARAILTRCGDGDERIPLLFKHDAPMIAGIIAALKAGKTYVPLDPSYPKERLAYILRDSQASTMLADDLCLDLATDLASEDLEIITFDINDQTSMPVECNFDVSSDAMAYILYTSGSTGQPKGIFQNHRNVLSHIRNYTNNLHINANDRLALLASYSFDAAVMDIFGALLSGATLYPIDVKRESLADLIEWMVDQEITIYHSTPTVYRYLFGSQLGATEFPNIRLVVLGGEEVQPRDVSLYKNRFSDTCLFVNGLGPTESTLSLQYFIDKQTEITRNSVPVGWPVDGIQIHLLNYAGEQVAIHGIGEIAIRGTQIALGYWNNAEMTNAKFLSDPDGGNRRIYRTGDLGRLLPDGSIEFVGRTDHQVKIRGHRVELGEIQAVLGRHASVCESVIFAKEDSTGDKHLVAYLIPRPDHELTTGEIRAYLKESLPLYMVPSSIIALPSFPTTPNGKVDLQALMALDEARLEPAKDLVPPRVPMERLLADIWCDVLGIEEIGVNDDFFELGGHSLTGALLIFRINESFEVNLPIRILFESPTIAGISAAIVHSRTQQVHRETVDRMLLEIEWIPEQQARLMLATYDYTMSM
jgi:surfactin family lipopeptide synthetase A